MRAHVSCFWTQKGGNEPREYEDGYAVADGSIVDDGDWDSTKPLRIALADGASESFLAGHWAAELTARYAAGASTDAAVRKAVADWPALLEAYCAEREERGKPIQWYEETKMEAGAHATLVTARFSDPSERGDNGRLELTALGDACVFGVRDDDVIASFPIIAAADFDTSPQLVQSRPADMELIIERLQRHQLTWHEGDSFYLGTDAISHWFLDRLEAGEKPWETLRDLGTDAVPDFAAWVAQMRAEHLMHNDDVTLIRVDVL